MAKEKTGNQTPASREGDALRDGYERGITKLIEIVRRINDAEWSPTPLRNEIAEIAERLEEVANLLGERDSAQSHIEAVHDASDDPEIGIDGLPIEPPSRFGSYQAMKWRIRELAASAREAANRLPDPRAKQALPFASRGLLHLRHDYGFAPPVMSNSSDERQRA